MRIEVLVGNCVKMMRRLPDCVVHVIATSPPYYLQRFYDIEPIQWPAGEYKPMPGLKPIKYPAWKGDLGNEPTIEMFIGHLVIVFREARRVLRSDGVLYVNLGETFAKRGGSGDQRGSDSEFANRRSVKEGVRVRPRGSAPPPHVKAKDRMQIPERFSLAMQADGWHYRDQVVWYKPSAMPSSVKDRCSVAHELVMMFTKNPKYFYNHFAIREKTTGRAHHRSSKATPKSLEATKQMANVAANPSFLEAIPDVVLDRHPRSVWTLSAEPTKIKHFAAWPTKLVKKLIASGTSDFGCCPKCMAPFKPVLVSKRVPTRPGHKSKVYYHGNWETGSNHTAKTKTPGSPYEQQDGSIVGNRDPKRHCTKTKQVGWRPTCFCCDDHLDVCDRCQGTGKYNHKSKRTGKTTPRTCKRCEGRGRYWRKGNEKKPETIPCAVLDPFGGIATTAMVADRMGRRAYSIELSPNYAAAGQERLEADRKKDVGPMFAGK